MPSRYEGSNQEAYDTYRYKITQPYKRRPDVVFGPEDVRFLIYVLRNWQRGDDDLKYAINNGDAPAREVLRARHRAQNAQFSSVPLTDISPEQIARAEAHLAERFAQGYSEITNFREIPSYGPSLIRVWNEAKSHGLPNDEAALYVLRWGIATPECWARDDERKAKKLAKIDPKVTKRLRQVTEWHQTGDPDIPWDLQVAGHSWQVRLNGFPRAYMYTLLIDGEVVGDFNNWPEVWDRGEKKPEVPANAAAVAPRPTPQIDASTLPDRYRSGERKAVWRDLVALGGEVRQPPYDAAARAVAEETMRRARHNVDLLLARLKELGYRFFDAKQVHRPMNSKEQKLLERAERAGLWLPLSARAWLQEVGQLDLNGSHPALCFMDDSQGQPGIHADPLQVWFWQMEFDWRTWIDADADSRDPMQCIVSMNARDKAARELDEEAEGGYYFTIPNGAADALLEDEPHKVTFVEYLRMSFEWGGFPGWSRYDKRPDKELAFLKEGLLPI